jgi:ribose transport system ATP-binding protein
MDDNSDLIIQMEEISKHYAGVQALSEVSFTIARKEVHAVVGENGAGKSTLMKILAGIVRKDGGKILFNNKEIHFNSPTDAIHAGIGVIHQELSMLPSLNILENLFMGRMTSQFGIVKWGELREKTKSLLEKVGLSRIDPYTKVKNLSISQRQLIEIARALSMNAQLIIMDEPNSSLTGNETEILFTLIDDLKKGNVTIIYVSHKIEEVLKISDRISVLRDGKYIGTESKKNATINSIIKMMVGHEIEHLKKQAKRTKVDILLEVSQLSGKDFHDISFNLHKGEILGLAGLVGAGRSELTRAIFGADSVTSGTIKFEGRNVRFKKPSEAIKNKIAMLPEDRKELSLFLNMPIHFNMTLVELSHLGHYGIINYNDVMSLSKEYTKKLSIKLSSQEAPVNSLSGGNQQKVALAKWLAIRPKLLILDEPTHGIDIKAKSEIYVIIKNLANEGIGIIIISSELPEIISMSDRILVMREGYLTGILEGEEITKDNIMTHATK